MEVTNLLSEAEVESDDIDETGEGQESRNNTLVDSTQLSEVPSVGHHDEVADIDSDVSEEGDQVGPLHGAVSPNQTRLISWLSPAAISAAVYGLSDDPQHEEDNEDSGSAQATTLKSKVSVVRSVQG